MPAPINLSPLNDLSLLVTLKDVNSTTGKVTPLLTGTVTHFISTSNLPTATAADPSLTGTAVHVGNGVWLIQYDAATLTDTLLNTLFASTPPYLIVVQPNGVRGYLPLTYLRSRLITVT